MLYTPQSTYILTSGADLNSAAEATSPAYGAPISSGSSGNVAIENSPWPPLIDAGERMDVAYRPNGLEDGHRISIGANYGSISSQANYQFRAHEYDGIAGMPGPIPYAGRPTYNNLEPIAYGLRVADPKQVAQGDELVNYGIVQNSNLEFTPGGVASIYPPEQLS